MSTIRLSVIVKQIDHWSAFHKVQRWHFSGELVRFIQLTVHFARGSELVCWPILYSTQRKTNNTYKRIGWMLFRRSHWPSPKLEVHRWPVRRTIVSWPSIHPSYSRAPVCGIAVSTFVTFPSPPPRPLQIRKYTVYQKKDTTKPPTIISTIVVRFR